MITYQKLSIETGIEGPKHDPYSYQVLIFENNYNKIELKQGAFNCWIKVNGKKFEEDEAPNGIDWMFKLRTGLHPWEFERIYQRIKNPKHCPRCGSTKRKWVSGFPGETFTVCRACEQIIDCDFHMGAII